MHSRRSFLNFINRSAPAVETYWLHVNRTAMACRFEITLPTEEREGVAAAVEALNEVDRIEAQLTVFRDTSLVSHINRRAAQEPVVVDRAVFELLAQCKEIHSETSGAFDITSGPLTRCWGFFKRQGRFPDATEIQTARDMVGSDKLLLDKDSRSVRFASEGMEINLGSIGKGYALDCVATSLRDTLDIALVSAASSSFRAVGSGGPDGKGWVVGLRNPRSKRARLGVLELHDCALSTSGSEEQFFDHQGKRFGHILDPRTGWPSTGISSVSVVCESAAMSDALSTAFFVGGLELAEQYCNTHPETLAVILEGDSEKPLVIGNHRNCQIRSGSA
jgi:FAD:protein FMN transferase